MSTTRVPMSTYTHCMRGGAPNIYTKNTGLHVVKWAGKEWSLSTNRATAEKMFLDPKSTHPGAMVNWLKWRQTKAAATAASITSPTIADLARAFMADYYNSGRVDTEAYYRSALRRFLNTYGRLHTASFSVEAFDAFRADLLTLALKPKTITHDLKAVKTMWLWGHPRGLCPPIDFRGIKLPRVRRGVPEPIPLKQIKHQINTLSKSNPTLAAWLAFNYLTACRPSEVCRVAHGGGVLRALPPESDGRKKLPAIPGAIIELLEHKTIDKTGISRFLLVNDEALTWLPHVRPLLPPLRSGKQRSVKSLLNYYGAALRRAGLPGIAHKLRDSAATQLLSSGVDQATVNLILGHAPTGELGSYGLPSLRVLRSKVALLTLQ